MPPSQRYNHYKHPTEEQHRTAEQFNWRDVYRLNIGIAIVAVIAAFFAAQSFFESKRQANIAQEQLTAMSPLVVKIVGIHIWNQGSGKPFYFANNSPDLISGNKIQGFAAALNTGRGGVDIVSSDIMITFTTGKIGMNYPGWGNPGENILKEFDARDPINPKIPAKRLAPGQQGEWIFDTVIPDDISGKILYIIGNTVYTDALGTQHAVYFAERYVPSERRFEEEIQTVY